MTKNRNVTVTLDPWCWHTNHNYLRISSDEFSINSKTYRKKKQMGSLVRIQTQEQNTEKAKLSGITFIHQSPMDIHYLLNSSRLESFNASDIKQDLPVGPALGSMAGKDGAAGGSPAGKPDEGTGRVPDKDEMPRDPDLGDEEKDAPVPD
uniref:Uncharacterized protein n=1 Tax=Sphaerodactylus townsendi TaxID=933632 RepID=A0ACB8ESR1_9SAUR